MGFEIFGIIGEECFFVLGRDGIKGLLIFVFK